MRRSLSATLLAALLLSFASPAAPLSTDDVTSSEVLVGDGGGQVVLLLLKGNRALIRIGQLPKASELDGLWLEYRAEQWGRRNAWVTEVHGRDRGTLQSEESGGGLVYTLYAPGLRDGLRLHRDEAESRKLRPESLLDQHREQEKKGLLAAVQRFDRKAEEREQEKQLAEVAAKAAKECGAPLDAAILWATIGDAQLKKLSISSYCAAPFEALEGLCRESAAARRLFAPLKGASCSFASGLSLKQEGELLAYTVGEESPNQVEFARDALKKLPAPPSATLAEAQALEQSHVCAADEHRVAVLAPSDSAHPGLSYGDGKSFVHSGEERMLSSGWFFDPRHFNKGNNADFRGYDLRYYSRLEFDEAKKSCKLVCGEQEHPLKLLEGDEAVRVLSGATFAENDGARRPHALARDDKGIYYYVDTGATEKGSRDFRVYTGPRGRLEQRQMTDVVADSAGEIFATKNGKLRLLVGGGEAQWIDQKRTLKLKALPITENYQLIYHQLGVYVGKRLGVPCDDF